MKSRMSTSEFPASCWIVFPKAISLSSSCFQLATDGGAEFFSMILLRQIGFFLKGQRITTKFNEKNQE